MKKRSAASFNLTRKSRILLISLAIVILLLGIITWRVWAFASHPLYSSLADLGRSPTRTRVVPNATSQVDNATPAPNSLLSV